MSSTVPRRRLQTSMKARRMVSVGLRLLVALVLIAFSVFPILWVISASLNPTGSLATQKLIPDNPGFDNYRVLLTSGEFPFWRWFGNSLKIASITAVLSLAITTTAAYAFSRFRFNGRKLMLKSILLIQVFPALLAIVAVFLMISQVGDVFAGVGLNTHASLIMVYLGGAMVINIWLMKGFLYTILREIYG